MLKVKLLNNCGYGGMENVKFPVIFKVCLSGSKVHMVSGRKLIRAGASTDWFSPEILYNFHIN